MWRSSWLFYESGSIPFTNWKGTVRDCAMWKVFIGRRVGQRAINKIEEMIIFKAGHLSGRREWQGFLHADGHYYGGWRGPTGYITSLLLTRKVQTVWMRLYFWERLKEKVGQVLNLGLISWTLAQVTPLWACSLLFNKANI